ncbi:MULTISPECIES: Asp23/Gls24 family envelope stress response protein [Thermosipho]|uniref:Alkaline shock protein n=1 Tax=Thermosipho affectus TaxID=660294 RepID=A0ABX3IJ21_9BACT|nr:MULTISPECIES: Asp23/Gls24 family envelope stress response protein [Thermosipho]ANQ53364.1 alkaline shock protein [Thermosipho sp. 1070]APT71814.1 alkaline shock protein [Thermosipho sp. 1063]MBT1248497.1 alkaline-shock protein [Thermosipho sp. 1244]ONN27828.1 alkaline shock protein [Thermosipho affectus]OOC45319.1 alkaline shock protein [Thermosipho sp. 1074]
MKMQTEFGELDITLNAIRKLVYFAILETYGPVSISSDSWFSKILSSEESRVKIQEDEFGHVKVDAYVELEYGTKISEVGRNIIENVKHKLQNLAGCESVEVNVHVIDVK